MAKLRSKYVCSECGYESSGWLGKCPSCMKWNTLLEEVYEEPSSQALKTIDKSLPEIMPLSEIEIPETSRIKTGSKELDRVLGGGLVPASLILIGGEPGIGKSTLILQICAQIAKSSRVLYVSGEESVGQIKLRADRLNAVSQSVFMASETSFERIERLIEKEKPDFVVIDSIQTVYSELLSSAPGSVSQVRDVTARLLRISKKNGITVFVVGHVTKEGAIAGPRVLEHMVDTVLYFEGERHQDFRILRAVKNRFGSTNEIGIFEMSSSGLKDVANPSGLMLEGRAKDQAGSAVVGLMEGTRPMLVEVQALVCPTSFGMPRRQATGMDYNRMTMLMAVLEKKVGMQLNAFDAYLNAAGGFKLDEPAADLGVVAAIASSFRNVAIDPSTVFFGEVGLTGEVRAVNQMDKRITECLRLGFKKCIVPVLGKNTMSEIEKGIDIVMVSTVNQALLETLS
ncbi:MAG: DNA repair protein RadA [Clostridiaceae bacterium]|jgi:DNA repair protein RadA/Sms|nr:DNA repair protein RadA [Clostridiaceae bacterium]